MSDLREALARAAKVYCGGELLDVVQRARLFPDSKHFVDMPMRSDPEDILAAFGALPEGAQEDAEALRAFIRAHFDEPGAELVQCTLEDWLEHPPLLSRVTDPDLRELLLEVHKLWPTLCRVVAPQVFKAPQRHSALPRKWPVILPGGRFRETYYWDSFWIVEGLLASGMAQTARGLVQNLLDDVETFGFVPNGGRVYYLNRSQPPLLCEMVAAVARALGEAAAPWLAEAVPLLQKEYEWWMSGEHTVVVDGLTFNRYFAAWQAPRPESYREDLETAGNDVTVYRELSTAAETGWDFSSRWSPAGSRVGGAFRLCETATTRVVPVDLNAVMYRLELTLAALSDAVDAGVPLAEVDALLVAGRGFRSSRAVELAQAAHQRRAAMEARMWQPLLGRWTDAWLSDAAAGGLPSPTLADFAAPLWAGLAKEDSAGSVVKALKASGLLGRGGAATTVQKTGEQWDAPNAWPPLQSMLIEGLRRLDASSGGPALAAELAQRWVGSCYMAWRRTGFMHEKYDAMRFGFGGSGGEYEPQVGFGWSNGVLLQLLQAYGPDLVAPEAEL